VSHELRTPLTTIRGNLGLLGRQPASPTDEQADILADMVDVSDRLIRLVNELLLLARADAGQSLASESLYVQPVLEDVVRQARQLDNKRQIDLDVTPGLTILGDPDALKQVLLVLLDNALKHSEGAIDVFAHRNGTRVEISVTDHGPGIPPDKLERVFDRFYRGNDSIITNGFGLGLPIAKALTEGMGGTIELESELGIGSSIFLRFSPADKNYL